MKNHVQLFCLKKKIYLFIFGCTGSSLLCGLSVIGVNGGYSLLVVYRLLVKWLLLLQSMGSEAHGLSSCGARA